MTALDSLTYDLHFIHPCAFVTRKEASRRNN